MPFHNIGGTLKTQEQKDKESLQGKWIAVKDIQERNPEFPLRAGDILPLIDRAIQHRDSTKQRHPVLSSLMSHDKLLLRCIFIHQDRYACCKTINVINM